MIWMLHRVQTRLFWTATLGGILIATGRMQANGPGEPAGTGSGVTGTAATGAAAGGARASGSERSAAPAEVSRGSQPAMVANGREARVQPVLRERGEVGNQAVVRGSEAMGDSRGATAGVASGRYVARNGNAWTDPAGGGQQQRYYGGAGNNNRQNGNRRRPGGNPYLYRYYGGYYPIYVDVPVITNYVDAGPDSGAGYDGGPAAAVDPGSAVGPVIAPSTINVSPDNGQPAADGAGDAAASPDAAQTGNHSPNPSLGPDSLVEAVQAELTRRGYFQGKVDAMFRADTEAALRHFQQDNYLAPTGHLNEATLHALNLD